MSGGRFPQRIKRGSCVVSIYRTPTKSYTAFTVVHSRRLATRVRRCARRHFGNQRLQFVPAEAVEEEVRHHQIKLLGRRLSGQRVHGRESDAGEFGLRELFLGRGDHAFAALDAGHGDARIRSQELPPPKKRPGPFPSSTARRESAAAARKAVRQRCGSPPGRVNSRLR